MRLRIVAASLFFSCVTWAADSASPVVSACEDLFTFGCGRPNASDGSEVSDKDFDSKVRNVVFPSVRDLLKDKVREYVSDPVLKRKLLARLDALKFKGTECPDIHEKMIGPYWNPRDNSFKYCRPKWTTNSEFQMALVCAHEMAHSIDNCGLGRVLSYKRTMTRAQIERLYPVPGLISCLRGRGSYAATPKVSPQSRKQHSCYQKGEDPIGEALADWWATEVLPGYVEKHLSNLSEQQKQIGYGRAFEFVCDEGKLARGNHAYGPNRVNFGFLVQPEIRAQMSCKESAKKGVYCGTHSSSAEPLQKDGVVQ